MHVVFAAGPPPRPNSGPPRNNGPPSVPGPPVQLPPQVKSPTLSLPTATAAVPGRPTPPIILSIKVLLSPSKKTSTLTSIAELGP